MSHTKSHSNMEMLDMITQIAGMLEFAYENTTGHEPELFAKYCSDSDSEDPELEFTLNLFVNQLLFAAQSTDRFDYEIFYNLGCFINHPKFELIFQTLTWKSPPKKVLQKIFKKNTSDCIPPVNIVMMIAIRARGLRMLSIAFDFGIIEYALAQRVEIIFTNFYKDPYLIDEDLTKVQLKDLLVDYHPFFDLDNIHTDPYQVISANPTCEVLFTCFPEYEIFGLAVQAFLGDAIIIISDKPDLQDFIRMNDSPHRWKIETVTPFLSCFSEQAYVHIYSV